MMTGTSCPELEIRRQNPATLGVESGSWAASV